MQRTGALSGNKRPLPKDRFYAGFLNTLMRRVREAIELCLEIEIEPEKSTKFIGMQRITV
jgi:hypothetical protein